VVNHGSFMDIPALLASFRSSSAFRQEGALRHPVSGYAPATRRTPSGGLQQPARTLKTMLEAARIIGDRGAWY
jgi:hypothetical protein